MIFELKLIAFICVSYLLLMFGIAYATERRWIPDAVVQHPITYILSLGIFASAWAFYGVTDLAFQFGYGSLAYYIGTGALFLFAPVVLAPFVSLAQRYQIHSLADLLTFRYHSPVIGVLATLCMLLSLLPLLALQLQAVADTLHILASQHEESIPGTANFTFRELMALLYCALLAVFTILFGSAREQHRGLITAMAFESLVKLFALCAIGLLAVYGVFGSFAELNQWLNLHPENLELLHHPIREGESHVLLLIFIATAIAMPHIFHMSVVENPMKSMTRTISWAFPLFLLLMALPIFPILWAGFNLGITLPPQYFTLGIPMSMGSPSLTILAFIGGLSAATGALVAITLALTTMLLNHWLLPLIQHRQGNIYHRILPLRRIVIASIFLASYCLYQWLNQHHYSLMDLALIAFIGTLQFLPGMFAVTYWPKGNRHGLIIGLSSGIIIWTVGLLIPTLLGLRDESLFSILPIGVDHWHNITLLSLGLNSVAFIALSHFTQPSSAEKRSADLCFFDTLNQPLRLAMDAESSDEFTSRLTASLGEHNAKEEVDRALRELGFPAHERRPYALRRLRDRLEANLSALLGISVATEILDQHIPHQQASEHSNADINLIEDRLQHQSGQLTGMAAELDGLRLYHRQTLQDLPMAVCTLGQDDEILMWNHAMSQLTLIDSENIIGSRLQDLEEPWQSLLAQFSLASKQAHQRQEVLIDGQPRWISLHKSIADSGADIQVILLDDITETQLLERELMHSERLASVGRLAAGVAHEIGNPVTGIACLAQNLKYDSDNPDVLESAQQILSQTERVTTIVQSLVNYSHSGHNQSSTNQIVMLYDCASEAIHLLSLQKEKTEVHYNNTIAKNIAVKGNNQRLIQVFINLLSNARDASPPNAEILVSARTDDQHIILSISDEGTGIPAELLERITEPFVTTKEPGEGTGLGLAVANSIVEEHKALLTIESPIDLERQLGTRMNISFPKIADTEDEF